MGSRVYCTEIIALAMAGTEANSLVQPPTTPLRSSAAPGHHLVPLPPFNTPTNSRKTHDLANGHDWYTTFRDKRGWEVTVTLGHSGLCLHVNGCCHMGPLIAELPFLAFVAFTVQMWVTAPAFFHPQHVLCYAPSLLSDARQNSCSFIKANLFRTAFIHKLMKDQNMKMLIFDYLPIYRKFC